MVLLTKPVTEGEHISGYIVLPVAIPNELMFKIDEWRGTKAARSYFIRNAVEKYVEALESKIVKV